jgi:MFS family permease
VTTSTREVSEVTEPTVHRDRADAAERRRFAGAVLGFAVLFTVVGRAFGEDIAMQLQQTPTTALGWRLTGWLVAAPPAVVTILVWHDRHRLRPRRRRDLSLLLSGWIGLSMFVLPARVVGVDDQFGTGALVGDPLSAGWAWGALAAVVGLAFSGLVMLVLRRTVDRPTPEQWDLTVRFLERAWLVLLVVSLGFALYGGRSGVFHGGT